MASASAQPLLPPAPAHPWTPPPYSDQNESNLRALLTAAAKRLPNNAEAHFHTGLLHMRSANGEDALRSFQRARAIFDARVQRFLSSSIPVPVRLKKSLARLRAHTAQAAHLAASSKLSREERAPLLDRLQADLVASTEEDHTQPDVWNALALLHLGEGGFSGARDILRAICDAFPDYLDALNNLGLAELALGNEQAAVACFQKVVLSDIRHTEALSNYGLVLLRNGVYEAAARAFRAAVDGVGAGGTALSFAWGGLAIAEAAGGRMQSAEDAAICAEMSADLVSQSRFALLLGCIRTRRFSDTLHRGLFSFDGQASVFVDMSGDPLSEGNAAGDAIAATAAVPAQSPSPGVHRSEVMPDDDRRDLVRDPRQAIEGTVTLLRGVARDVQSSLSSCALGAALRVRHDYLWEETGNRNYGAESAERLVEALEADSGDATAWVQLALLQLGAGEYESARDFCTQAVSRDPASGSGWNALGVSYQLNCELKDAITSYEKAIAATEASSDQCENANNFHKSNAAAASSSKSEPLNATADVNTGVATEPENAVPDLVVAGSGANTPIPLVENALEVCGPNKDLKHADGQGKDFNRPGLAVLSAVYNNLGNAKRQEGASYVEAEEAYEKSLRLGGESAAVYNNLALLYITMERLDDAEKMLTHALTISPFCDAAVSNLLKLRRLRAGKSAAISTDDDVGTTNEGRLNSD